MAVYLITLGAEGLVNPVTVQSPLHAACQHGHIRLIRLLLEVSLIDLNANRPPLVS